VLLWVSGRHVGAHLEGHQYGVSIQISVNLGETLLRIARELKTAETWFLARLFILLASIIYQILEFIYWTVTIFSFDHMTDENREFAFVTRRPYCPGRPKKLCFTTQSLAVKTVGARLSVVKQSFFGLQGQYGRRVTQANLCFNSLHRLRDSRLPLGRSSGDLRLVTYKTTKNKKIIDLKTAL